jgi:Mg2+/citrate symporter
MLSLITSKLSTFLREVCLRNHDIESYLVLLQAVTTIAESYGASSRHLLEQVVFGDHDFNCSHLVSLLVRQIMHKCDMTEVNLGDRNERANQAKTSVMHFFSNLEPSLTENYLEQVLEQLQ